MLTNIVGVKFKKEGRIYSFSAADHIVRVGDHVIVSTDNGLSLGTVVTDVSRCPECDLPANLKKIVRRASAHDMQIKAENEKLEEDAKKFFLEKIQERGLPMKLVDVDCHFDRGKIIFYFTAEGRVDFRDLVKDLVQRFKTRIELKQIGARHEARITKGMGICGRMVCCAGIIQNLERVTVKMAKEQSMSLNPEKISGLCGRLMCCLAFEHDEYLGCKKGKQPARDGADKQADEILNGEKENEELENLDDDNGFI